MEFEGRISRVLPVRSGTSQKGEWKVLPFVFEYFEKDDQRWPDRVLLETMDTNIMAQIGAYLKKGSDGKAVVENGECVLMYELKCRVGFSHSVREYDKQDGTKVTINNIRCYKFEIAGQQGQQPQRPAGYAAGTTAAPTIPPQAQPMAAPTMEQQAPFPPFPPQPAGGQVDDLPF
jgi:hypothetical protein